MTDIDVDEMAEDIFEQQKERKDINNIEPDINDNPQKDKKHRNLNSIQPYQTNELIGADDFDIAYRTPSKLYLEEKSNLRDIAKSGVLPETYTMVPDPEKYFDDLAKRHPEKIESFKRPPGEYNRPKYRSTRGKVNKNGPVSAGLYSLAFDEIAIREPDSLSPEDTLDVIDTLIHEDIHQKQRRMEYHKPKSRVISEPSVPLFEKMFKEDIVMSDFKSKLKKANTPFEMRKELLKNRKAVTANLKKEIFPEQLAYYGDYFIRDVVTDPRTKTERALNRLKFKDAPIWGMQI